MYIVLEMGLVKFNLLLDFVVVRLKDFGEEETVVRVFGYRW